MGINNFKDKNIAILGFGIEGKDILGYLMGKCKSITVLDKKKESDLDFGSLDKSEFNIICGPSYLENGLTSYDTIFRSPGDNPYIPEILDAENKGVEISSSIKLFFDLCPRKIIGVTGTKGKGTTCTLIYEILKKSGYDVYLAGNIGTPVMEILPKLGENSWVVLELSSFQLIDLTKGPHISVILNITLDHLDWHKDKDEYIKSKSQLVKFQKKDDIAIINYDYPTSRDFANQSKAKIFYFSSKNKVEGCFIEKEEFILKVNDNTYDLGDVNKLLLRGKHNWENVSASICAGFLAGADIKSIKQVVFTFKGLEHRLELVDTINGVKYYNDSFSTNPQTTIAAINSFTEPITVILGGYDKGLNYDEAAKVISEKGNVENVILIGDIAEKIRESLLKVKYNGNVILMGKRSMKDVVKICIQNTVNNGIVLLSPGASSFDMFKDYKDRGNAFKNEVEKLNG